MRCFISIKLAVDLEKKTGRYTGPMEVAKVLLNQLPIVSHLRPCVLRLTSETSENHVWQWEVDSSEEAKAYLLELLADTDGTPCNSSTPSS